MVTIMVHLFSIQSQALQNIGCTQQNSGMRFILE